MYKNIPQGESEDNQRCSGCTGFGDSDDVATALQGDRLAANQSPFDAKRRVEENAATPSPDPTARAMATALFELRLKGRIRRRDCRFELLVLMVFSNDKIYCEEGVTLLVCAVLPIWPFHTFPPPSKKTNML